MKTIFNTEALYEEMLSKLKEVIPELTELNKDEEEMLQNATSLFAVEAARLPFTEGSEKRDCQNSLKIAQGVFMDIGAIKALGANKALQQTFEAVVKTAVKAAITLVL